VRVESIALAIARRLHPDLGNLELAKPFGPADRPFPSKEEWEAYVGEVRQHFKELGVFGWTVDIEHVMLPSYPKFTKKMWRTLSIGEIASKLAHMLQTPDEPTDRQPSNAAEDEQSNRTDTNAELREWFDFLRSSPEQVLRPNDNPITAATTTKGTSYWVACKSLTTNASRWQGEPKRCLPCCDDR
jgi:hypothetical protein